MVASVNSVVANIAFGKARRFSHALAQFLKYLFEDQVFETDFTDQAIKIQKPFGGDSVESLETLISPFLTFKKF